MRNVTLKLLFPMREIEVLTARLQALNEEYAEAKKKKDYYLMDRLSEESSDIKDAIDTYYSI